MTNFRLVSFVVNQLSSHQVSVTMTVLPTNISTCISAETPFWDTQAQLVFPIEKTEIEGHTCHFEFFPPKP